MDQHKNECLAALEAFIVRGGSTYSFDKEASVHGVELLLRVFQSMGLNPMKTEDLKKGFMELFRIEIVNMPDLNRDRYIFTPNHVSDFDALILGLLHPHIRVVAKVEWVDNAKLRQFLDLHYDLVGLDRTSLASLRRLLSESIRYFNDDDDNKHYLVFGQGTISDFNNNSPERISTIAQRLSEKTGVPIVNLFVEQVSLHHPTRIVFDEPMRLDKAQDFRTIWLEREKAMQDALTPPARRPTLTEKHANNNKPGDPFF